MINCIELSAPRSNVPVGRLRTTPTASSVEFVLYRVLLRAHEPDRELWLAVPDDTWKTLFLEPVGEAIRSEALNRVLRVDASREEIVQWETAKPGAA